MFDASSFAQGGQVSFQLFLKRNGAEYAEMRLRPDHPMSLTMTEQAAVKIRLQAQAEYDGKINYYQDTLVPYLVHNGKRHRLGEYIIVASRKSAGNGTGAVYSLTAFDLNQRIKAYRIEERLYYAPKTSYSTIIENLLVRAGITDFSIESNSFTLSHAREDWPRGIDALTVINGLLREINYHSLYMDLNGVVRARAFRAPTSENLTIQYNSSEVNHILLPGADIEVDAFEHPNVFYYTCENPDIARPLNVVVENKSAANPYSTINQGRVPVFRIVNAVANIQVLTELANREMMETMMTADTIQFSTGLNLNHSVFDLVSLHKREYFGVVRETGWRMSLKPGGVMKHTGKQVAYL